MQSLYKRISFFILIIAGIFFVRFLYLSNASSGGPVKVNEGSVAPLSSLISSPASLPLTTASSVPATSSSSGSAISSFIKETAAPTPVIHAAAWLVADLQHGTLLASQNETMRWPTASLTKLMTAVIASEMIPPETRITITADMFAADPSEANLAIGGTYAASDLLPVMLLPSSNVAAEAFADFAGRTSFIAAMNARAAAWGMHDTFFDDPSGISAANQSTAFDIFTLARNIYMSYPQIFSITRNASVIIKELSSGKSYQIKSINNFAGMPDFLGGKTGHTNEASGNLFSLFEYHGHPLAVVVLGTESRFADTLSLYAWVKNNFK